MKLDDKTSDLFPNEAPTGKKRKTKKKQEINDLVREVRALSNLDELQYEHHREAAAERLGIRFSKLDQMVKKERQKRQSNSSGFLAPPQPWHSPVDGGMLLTNMRAVLNRYCILPAGADLLVSLWCIQAHAHDALDISPLLALQSPEKRCGKTTLLSVIEALVPKPMLTSHMTTASIFRLVDAHCPTLLLDEADTYMTQNDELRGLMNGGHNRRTAQVARVVGEELEPKIFNVFAPKVIAGIGTLPETMQDRSIVIPLRRKMAKETISGFRSRDGEALEPLMRQANRWAQDHLSEIRFSDPYLPDGLNDRAKDNAMGITAIADLIHPDCGAELREVLVANAREAASTAELGTGTWLLKDIRDVLTGYNQPDITSAELIQRLCKLAESPWQRWHGGRAISPKALAGLLRDFGISIHKTAHSRTYRTADFADPFERYLGSLR